MRGLLLPSLVLAMVTVAGCVGQAPGGLTCEATSEGNELSWDAVENATGYRIYRIEGGESEEEINVTGFFETEDTSFTDTNVTDGTTYLYMVTAVFEEGESPPASCEVTAVPFFTSPAVLVVALVGSVGAYAMWKRRG